MSTVKANNVQIGQSLTATNNFTWYQPTSPDGTVRLGNGNSGSVTDILTVSSSSTYKFAVSGASNLNNTTIDLGAIEINALGTGNRYAFVDFHGDDTYTDYGLRIIRNNTGANTSSEIVHKGTGALNINCVEAGYISLQTTNTERARINASGALTIPYQPAFFATGSGGFVTVAVGSYFPFNSLNAAYAGSNRNGGYNTSTYLYTAPVAGLYQIYAQLYCSTTGSSSVSWWKNGVELSFGGDTALAMFDGTSLTTAGLILNGSMVIELAAGDYVGIKPRTGLPNSMYVYMGHSAFFGVLVG